MNNIIQSVAKFTSSLKRMGETPQVKYRIQNNGLYTVSFNGQTVTDVLFLTKFGSKLYGTDGPNSDDDYKAIYMESLENIILKKDTETRNFSTGEKSDKNSANDIDFEFIELRKFIKDAFKGQTYAIEILNVKEPIFCTDIFGFFLDRKEEFLSNNMAPFLGYCRAQASKYGLKGERYKATEEALKFITDFSAENPNKRVIDFIRKIPKNKYVFIVEKAIQDRKVTLLEINEKQFGITIPVKEVIEVISKLVNKYGDRSRSSSDGVDWKSVSHAFRVLYEFEEISKTGSIEFPLKKRDFLKKVKNAEIEYTFLQELMDNEFCRITQTPSNLPEEIDITKFDEHICNLYKGK